MEGKIGIWLAVLLVILQICTPVYAAPDNNLLAEAVSGYCMDGELYVYLRLDAGYDAESLDMKLRSGEASAEAEGTIIPVTTGSTLVHYVLMVEGTESMSGYLDEINAFADSLAAKEKQEADYTVAVFGSCFEVVQERLTDKNEVAEAIAGLECTGKLSDPYMAAESALAYLDGYPRKSGELVNLIVITDGKTALGIEDADETHKIEKELARSAADRIANSPEVVVSTLCMEEWDEAVFEAFAAGKGIHEDIDEVQDAEDAGERMAQYVDSLCLTSFKLSEIPSAERFSVEVQIQGRNSEGQLALLNVGMEGVPNLNLFSDATLTETSQEEPSAAEEPSGTVSDIVEGRDGESGDAGACMLFIIIPAACVLITAGICILAFIKKKASGGVKKARGAVAEPAPGSIAMKLEVYAGNRISKETLLYLLDSITIGSSPECSLRFDDPDMSPLNSRIFIENQMIYIEDLGSKAGTALGGMRIQSRNRLRSGDVISIGAVEFCLRF